MEGYGILKNGLGAEHQRTIKVIHSLGDLYDAWGKPEPAAEWRAKVGEEATEPPFDGAQGRLGHEGTKGEEPSQTQPASQPAGSGGQ